MSKEEIINIEDNTLLKDLECPKCSNQGYVIETGEEL